MKITRSTTAILGLGMAVTVAAALTGCSAASSGGASSSPQTLTLWAAQSTPDTVKAVITSYEKESGNTINLLAIPDAFESNLLTKWAAGQRPDVMFFQPGPGFLSQLNPAKNLQDLSSLPFVGKTKYGLADSGAIGGKHYTATYGFPSVFGVYYNTKVFADNGITVPTSISDLQAAATKLKAAGVMPFELTGGDAWSTQLPYIESATDAVASGAVAKINAGTEKVTNSSFVEAAGTARGWVEKGWVNPDYVTATYAAVPPLLQSGSVAMYPMASWMNGSFTDPSNIGFFPYPSKSGKTQWQSSNVSSVQLPKTGDSAREAAARDFVKYLTVGAGYEALIKANGDPSIIDGVSDPSNVSSLSKLQAKAFASGGIASLDQQIQFAPTNRADLMASVLAGSLSPADFSQQYQDGIDKLKKLQG